jgi:hypothetical protein
MMRNEESEQASPTTCCFPPSRLWSLGYLSLGPTVAIVVVEWLRSGADLSPIYALDRGLVDGGVARCTQRVGAIGAHRSAVNKREENKIF